MRWPASQGAARLFAIGAASLGASGVLFGIDYRRGREGDKTALLSLGGRF